MSEEHVYIAIDLKSFYASVECVERGLDPLDTHLVVADRTRTDKTICLAVTPSLKALGVPGRPRLFEVEQRVRAVNQARMAKAPGHSLQGVSCSARELAANHSLGLDFVTAMPRMAHYIRCSTQVYQVYLRHLAPEDILVYSIDEVFLDVTAYLSRHGLTAVQMARLLLAEVLAETGVTATAGIGPNLYLAKVAMDIVAKHAEPDRDGARVAELDVESYRRRLWTHRPLTDFWRVGPATARHLAENGMHTMGDVCRCSLRRMDLLYRLFGVNAELLIDHAWGWEPCTIADARAYVPQNRSLSSGQVLMEPYAWDRARVIVREMTEELALQLVEKRLAAGQITLTIGYDTGNLGGRGTAPHYRGPVSTDHYGRQRPAHAHGTRSLDEPTSSAALLVAAALDIYDHVTDPGLTVRRVTVDAGKVADEREQCRRPVLKPLSLVDHEREAREREAERRRAARERRVQEAVLDIRRRFGKNAILKGVSFEEGATGRSRNEQIGGHRA